MSSKRDDDVVWRLGGDTTSLEAANKRAVASFKKMAGQGIQGLTQLAKWGAAAAAASAAAATAVIKHNLAAIDSQAKLAQQLNTTSASMATLKRSGELTGVSMQQISVASRTLEVRIGEAEQGLKSSADAFDALKINASELAKLPLDKRLETINRAMLQNVDASQRAAYAADLFGTRAATAIKLLDADTIKRARDETEKFGLALNDVQAAQIERANDTLSEAALVIKGLAQQMTVRLAPIIDAVGRLFIDNAKRAGNFGEQSNKAMGAIVAAASFVVDAIASIQRIFDIVTNTIVAAGASIKHALLNPFVALSEIASKLPGKTGKSFSEINKVLTSESDAALGVIGIAWDEIKDKINEPLPGGQFKTFVAEAQEASLTAAEAMVAAREKMAAPIGGESSMGGKEKGELQKKLDSIRELNASELELLQEKIAAEVEILAEAREQKLIAEEEFEEQLTATADRFNRERTSIEKREADRRKQIAENEKAARMAILQGLTSLMNSESRKMFEIGKAAAISQAVINTYESAVKSYNAMASIPYIGPVLGAAAAAAAIATGMNQVQAIRSQSFGKAGGPAAASTTEAVNAQSAPVGGASGGGGSDQNVFVSGDFDDDTFFSGSRLKGIAKGLLELQKDGAEIFFPE